MHESDQTLVNSKSQDAAERGPLRLLYAACEIVLSAGDGDLVIGRDASCGLVVETAYTSRLHCTVAWQHGKFVLSDHSTNGTWLRFGRAEPLHVHNEIVPLAGAGSFRLGQTFGDNDSGLILFKV